MFFHRSDTLKSVVCSLLVFSTLPLGSALCQSISPEAKNRDAAVKAFLEEKIEFDRYLFPPGKFPQVRWKNAERVEQLMGGSVPLTAQFFSDDFSAVQRAVAPGRFGAAVSGRTPDGFKVIRYVTLYCCPVEFDDYSPDAPLTYEQLPGYGISADQWERYRKNRRRYSFGSLLLSPAHDPDAAIFFSGMSELGPGPHATPRLRDRQWWTEFKRRRDAGADTPGTRPVVRGASKAGLLQVDFYSPPEVRRIQDVCQSWADSAATPLNVTVLHDGNVAFAGSYGKELDGSPANPSAQRWMASITKLLTGILVMQFVDAGILDLDGPLSRYLPELGEPCPLTLRHLMTHTTGLSWAGEWASDWNPSMENQVRQALPYLTPGREFTYHRAGYALAAKVLERLSGRTVPALFDTLILNPLGMGHSFADNSYGGLYATTEDLSRLGQMLLNRGSFGEARILSERAWDSMLPKPLALTRARVPAAWGIGCTLLGGNGLSDSTFGHEAASGSLFRVDPVHRLVVVVGCDNIGTDYAQYERHVARFLRAVTSPWGRPRE